MLILPDWLPTYNAPPLYAVLSVKFEFETTPVSAYHSIAPPCPLVRFKTLLFVKLELYISQFPLPKPTNIAPPL